MHTNSATTLLPNHSKLAKFNTHSQENKQPSIQRTPSQLRPTWIALAGGGRGYLLTLPSLAGGGRGDLRTLLRLAGGVRGELLLQSVTT